MDDSESTESGSSNMHDSTGKTYGLSRSMCLPVYIYKYMQFTPFSFTDNEKMYFSTFTFFTLTKSYTNENFEPLTLKIMIYEIYSASTKLTIPYLCF